MTNKINFDGNLIKQLHFRDCQLMEAFLMKGKVFFSK